MYLGPFKSQVINHRSSTLGFVHVVVSDQLQSWPGRCFAEQSDMMNSSTGDVLYLLGKGLGRSTVTHDTDTCVHVEICTLDKRG